MGLNSISIDASVSDVHPDAIVCLHQHPTHSTSDISANLLPTYCRRLRILSSSFTHFTSVGFEDFLQRFNTFSSLSSLTSFQHVRVDKFIELSR